ncbi:glia maturation factor beta [Aureobasidium sp. EXF-12298]|nr:glia maturation factor beta [Aureobasidium sp. EXF-12298]KAI4759404.1 glia maturation factor beta [Aureobasidium sp. EXF-12344]KAI4777427.1 glia maturation factor beta [Aureobasidium sp. EXF-3400]
MASESRLYTFSPETKTALRKFRLGTSRAKDPQAVIWLREIKNAEWLKPLSQGTDQIDKKTLEISKADDEVYTDLTILGEELPDHSPRFILLSYPLTMASGRLSVPYVMLYYLPVTCNSELKMLYAGAKELMRNQAEVGRIIEIDSAEDLEEIEDQLRGEE